LKQTVIARKNRLANTRLLQKNKLANDRLVRTNAQRNRLEAASTLAKAKVDAADVSNRKREEAAKRKADAALAAFDKTDEAKVAAAGKVAEAKTAESQITNLDKLLAAGKKADAKVLAADMLVKNRDTLTTTQKEYAQGVKEGFEGNLREWKDGTLKEKRLYDEYVASSVIAKDEVKPFHKWMMDWRKAGGVNISLGAREDIKAKKYYTSPKGLVADVNKYISSDEVQNELIRYSDDPVKLNQEKIRLKEQYIVGKLSNSGEILDSWLEGRTFVFKVKWLDGSVSEVRYAN
jgi:hypothetical protein